MAYRVNYEIADTPKKCVICRTTFTEFENTGRWLCMQHEGSIENGRFTCCNMPTGYSTTDAFYQKNLSHLKRGCVPCDHRASLEIFTDLGDGLVTVPLEHAPLLKTKKEARVVEFGSNNQVTVKIRRFDKDTSDKLRVIMNLNELAKINMTDPSYLLGSTTLVMADFRSKRKSVNIKKV